METKITIEKLPRIYEKKSIYPRLVYKRAFSPLEKIDYPKVQPSSSNNHSDLVFLTLP